MSKFQLASVAGITAVLLAPQLFALNPTPNDPNRQRGFASALPLGMQLAPGSSAAHAGLHIKEEGRQLGFPTPWTSANYPNPGGGQWVNYSRTSMFGSWAQHMEINGHSSGNAIIPGLDHNGVPSVGNTGTWMSVIVSVSNDSLGAPGSLIRRRTQSTLPGSGSRTTPGSDLVGYYYGESHGLPAGLAGSTLIEQVAEGMGLAGTNEDLNALDLGLGVNTRNTATSSFLLFPTRNQYYFTVSKASVPGINAHASVAGQEFAVNLGGMQVPANAATIYRVTWNGSSWTTPLEFRTPTDLGLVAGVHDLDALEVSGNIVVYSIDKNVPSGYADLPSQLMIRQGESGTNVPRYPLMSNDGTNGATAEVVDKTGATDDTSNADGVCIIDPEAFTFDTHVGIPVAHFNGAPGNKASMGLSVVRWTKGTPSSYSSLMIAQVSGWGNAAEAFNTTVKYSYSLDYDPLLPGVNGTWHLLGGVYRSKTDFTVDLPIRIPSDLAGNTVFLAAETISGDIDSGVPLKSWISAVIF